MKLYNSKEISAILKKAAEHSSADTADTSLGLSIEELEQVASEVGIDPKHIKRAAGEVDADSKKGATNFWGGPFTYQKQILVEREITTDQWEEMLISIQNFFQAKGQVSSRTSVNEWSSPWGSTNSARVTTFKQNGKTKINVNWHGPLTPIPFYIPVPLMAIVSLFFASDFLTLSAVPGMAFTILATGLTFITGRWALRRQLNKGFKKLQQLIVELDKISSQEVPEVQSHPKRKPLKHTENNGEDSLKNILIDEEESIGSDVMTTGRNRSRT